MSPKEQRAGKQYLNMVIPVDGNLHLPVWNPYQKYVADGFYPILSNVRSVLQRLNNSRGKKYESLFSLENMN